MILLQLGSVQPHWRTFGSAAGVDNETLDMVRHHPPAKVPQCQTSNVYTPRLMQI